MLIKIISLPFDSTFGGFNDFEVRDFLKDKELISANEHFFIKNDVPYLTFVLRYFPHRSEISVTPLKEKSGDRDEWRRLLTDADMSFFNILRDWRSQRCKKDGLPPYAIFNNLELAYIVKNRPQSSAELMQIKGIGKSKVDKYGAEILAFSKIGTEDLAKTEGTNET